MSNYTEKAKRLLEEMGASDTPFAVWDDFLETWVPPNRQRFSAITPESEAYLEAIRQKGEVALPSIPLLDPPPNQAVGLLAKMDETSPVYFNGAGWCCVFCAAFWPNGIKTDATHSDDCLWLQWYDYLKGQAQ